MDEEEIMRMPGMGADETNDYPIYRRHRRFWQLNWKRVHFAGLPSWLQDNEFLHSGHRPPMPSFLSCFKSIFSLHTETGNIFTHMYGEIFHYPALRYSTLYPVELFF
jgi:adiponectin receptor